MRVGIPSEIKNHEYRVAITPGGRPRAGPPATRCSFRRARARAPPSPTSSTSRPARRSSTPPTRCGPRPTCCSRSRSPSPRSTAAAQRPDLFTYLHLAASAVHGRAAGVRHHLDRLRDRAAADGALPLLAPMSEVAGRLPRRSAPTT